MRWDAAAMQWDAVPCYALCSGAMRWSLERQTDDAQAHTLTRSLAHMSTRPHTLSCHMGTTTSTHGAPVTAGDASVAGVHTGRQLRGKGGRATH